MTTLDVRAGEGKLPGRPVESRRFDLQTIDIRQATLCRQFFATE